MIHIYNLYESLMYHIFKITYWIVWLDMFYFWIKSVIVNLANLLKVKRNNKTVKFTVEFFAPAAICLGTASVSWYLLQMFNDKILSVVSLIFIGCAGIWWRKHPLNIPLITKELKHFSPLAYFTCKAMVCVGVIVVVHALVAPYFSHNLFYIHYSYELSQLWESVCQMCGYGSSEEELLRAKYANAWHYSYRWSTSNIDVARYKSEHYDLEEWTGKGWEKVR